MAKKRHRRMTARRAGKKFRRLLSDLWARRTRNLLKAVAGSKVASKKKFSKPIRDRFVRRMLEAAHDTLVLRIGRKEYARLYHGRHRRHIRGYGFRNRYRRIRKWAERHLTGPIVYSFWRNRRCLYVGKGATYKRLGAYKKSIYLKEATLLKVWRIRSLAMLPKAECLAVHLFQPRDNIIGPARLKKRHKCPVCKELRKIRRELRSLFRLKG